MAGLPKEIYIVVAESDLHIEDIQHGRTTPIAFESNCLDLESAEKFKKKISNKYGKTAIYKAVKISKK